MSFDIPLHISDNSPEAKAIQQVMLTEHVGAEEAVLSILRKSTAIDAHPSEAGPTMHQNKAKAPNLQVAESMPIFGAFAGNSEFQKSIEQVIASRPKRYSKLA